MLFLHLNYMYALTYASLKAICRQYARKYLNLQVTMRYQDKVVVAKVLRMVSDIIDILWIYALTRCVIGSAESQIPPPL